MRISDWSSDVCTSDLASPAELRIQCGKRPWRRIEATGRPVSMIRKRGSEDACMASIIPVGAARVAGGVDPARYTGPPFLRPAAMQGPTFQQLIQKLNAYWAAQGCVLVQPLDLEVGAGTFHPATFLRSLGPEPWNAAYVQPCRRPTDGRSGQNPTRLQRRSEEPTSELTSPM